MAQTNIIFSIYRLQNFYLRFHQVTNKYKRILKKKLLSYFIYSQTPLNLANHEHNFDYITKLERNQKEIKEKEKKFKRKKES